MFLPVISDKSVLAIIVLVEQSLTDRHDAAAMCRRFLGNFCAIPDVPACQMPGADSPRDNLAVQIHNHYILW